MHFGFLRILCAAVLASAAFAGCTGVPEEQFADPIADAANVTS
jgi:hypothetical protein